MTTENTDNLLPVGDLIAEARAYVKTYEPRMGTPKLEVTLISGLLAALDAVQPVTPDREKGLEVLDAHRPWLDQTACYEGGCYCGWKGEEAEFNGHVLDALLASGVLGQPQPQPDRETVRRMVYDAGGGAFMSPAARYGQSEAITDALLPLLGQPRTDARRVCPRHGYTCPSFTFDHEADAPLDPKPSRLEVVARLLDKMPILSSDSSREPKMTVRMADLTAIRDVAHGLTHPDEWVHEPCDVSRGEHLWNGEPMIFAHSPHHWTDYQDGRDPLRLPHWCNGTVEQDQARYPRTDEAPEIPGFEGTRDALEGLTIRKEGDR